MEGLKRSENLIKNNSAPLPNILASLTTALNGAIQVLPYASSINLKPQGIKDSLSKEAEKEKEEEEEKQFTQQYQAIFENFQSVLSLNNSSQKLTP